MIDRVLNEANYFVKNNQTIREVANMFNVSKSTVHKDLKYRLPLIDNDLFIRVNNILHHHLLYRHIKGGESTRIKYKKMK